MIVFHNGALDEFPLLHDTDGNVLNASDGGIISVDGWYHWYGLALRPLPFGKNGSGGQVSDTGVVMYRSRDLSTWEYEGVILRAGSSNDTFLRPPLRFERPKLLFNKMTGRYVLWCHFVKSPGDHGFTDGAAEALSASCDRVNGNYRVERIFRPIDRNGYVRDCTLFENSDDAAYFIYDRHVSEAFNSVLKPFERCLHIVRLTDDYLDETSSYARIDACDAREAPCMFKREGKYYLITSGLTGWEYNEALYYMSDSPLNGWKRMGNPCVGEGCKTTFNSQPTQVVSIKRRLYLLSERHNTRNFVECSHILLPLEFDADGRITIQYKENVII
ncbi:MAG: family 43 glycosylhydrolase [Clostridiales bacterium]|nr:family 43 glycosylhydrolase [Clostridiales bacterium]